MSILSKWKTKWEAFVAFANEVKNWKQVVCYGIKVAAGVFITWMILHYSAGSAYRILVEALFGG